MHRSKSRTLSIGSLSTGTMRPEDLIPAFLDAAEGLRLSKQDRQTVRETRREFDRLDYSEDPDGTAAEASHEMCDQLFDLLGNYTPDYCYFGAHPGDGADYGVWPSIEDAVQDGSLPSYGDDRHAKYQSRDAVLADFPDATHVLYVNDHGNATLYRRAGRRWIEVWAIV